MSLDRAQPNAQPLSSVEELVGFFRAAERPVARHWVGLEHEKLIYPNGGIDPVPYEGERGISAVLKGLEAYQYQPFREAPDGPVIALTRGKSTVSLEPGGQFELSGAPAPTARAVHQENVSHIQEVKKVCRDLGLRLVALGYRPFGTVAQMPWMPKTRYQAMRETLSKHGRLALDMMLMTATGQVSFDWSDEADCIRKVTAAARLSPLMVALYANSPIVRGKDSGLMSYRSHVWTEVDPARCGYLPSMLDGSFSYRSYVEWALDAPLLFLRRGGQYLRPDLTFRRLLKEGFEGQPAFYSDWVDHLSTLFPEVRIKRVLEIRGADCVSAELTGALAALFRGILYERSALSEAEQLLPRFSYAEHLELHREAGRNGLRGKFKNLALARLCQELVGIAERGLKRLDASDVSLLEPLRAVAIGGRSPAERVLEAYKRLGPGPELLAQFEL
jgi:glutamate--cysteine ligase